MIEKFRSWTRSRNRQQERTSREFGVDLATAKRHLSTARKSLRNAKEAVATDTGKLKRMARTSIDPKAGSRARMRKTVEQYRATVANAERNVQHWESVMRRLDSPATRDWWFGDRAFPQRRQVHRLGPLPLALPGLSGGSACGSMERLPMAAHPFDSQGPSGHKGWRDALTGQLGALIRDERAANAARNRSHARRRNSGAGSGRRGEGDVSRLQHENERLQPGSERLRL